MSSKAVELLITTSIVCETSEDEEYPKIVRVLGEFEDED